MTSYDPTRTAPLRPARRLPEPPRRLGEADLARYVDLDVLRGWRERRDPSLDAPHSLPPLAKLVCLDAGGGERFCEPIYGPDVLLGRFHPQHGPVDVVFGGLVDAESYRLGAPHLHLSLGDDGTWTARQVSPTIPSFRNDTLLADTQQTYPLADGDELLLGVTRFVFRVEPTTYEDWLARREALLRAADRPALFLMRNGGLCGPRLDLDEANPRLLGRSFPSGAELPGERPWSDQPAPDWDLAGLPEKERRFVGFHHVRVRHNGRRWVAEPLSRRQRTFVNRLPVISPTALESGDELGLGPVLFHFHHPARLVLPRRKKLVVPAVVNWNEGRPAAPLRTSSEHVEDT